MKKILLSVLIVSFLVFLGCGDGSGGGGGGGGGCAVIDRTFDEAIADGSKTKTTTEITLGFNGPIANFSKNDISFSTLDDELIKMCEEISITDIEDVDGEGVYNLKVEGITGSGEIYVNVSKAGYKFTPPSLDIEVFYFDDTNVATFNSVSVETDENTGDTTLTLVFNKVIPGFAASNIIPTGKIITATVQMSDFDASAAPTYTLVLSGIKRNGELRVTISKQGFEFQPDYKITEVTGIMPDAFIDFSGYTGTLDVPHSGDKTGWDENYYIPQTDSGVLFTTADGITGYGMRVMNADFYWLSDYNGGFRYPSKTMFIKKGEQIGLIDDAPDIDDSYPDFTGEQSMHFFVDHTGVKDAAKVTLRIKYFDQGHGIPYQSDNGEDVWIYPSGGGWQTAEIVVPSDTEAKKYAFLQNNGSGSGFYPEGTQFRFFGELIPPIQRIEIWVDE